MQPPLPGFTWRQPSPRPERPGNIAPWTNREARFFNVDGDTIACAACGEPIQVGQVVQERPAFSLRFYHVTVEDCLVL